MRKHQKFICTPLIEILKEAIQVTNSNMSISNHPLSEYILQSIFMKMTGAQEQKLKCILWDLSTDDFDFRYKYVSRKGELSNIGECSSYEDKNNIYKCIKKHFSLEEQFEQFPLEKERQQVKDIIDNLEHISELSYIATSRIRQFNSFSEILGEILEKEEKEKKEEKKKKKKNNQKGLLCSKYLEEIYEKNLYRHRNRIAHNLTSYQDNLPSLITLNKEKDGLQNENYFLWFSILILIDEKFISLYKAVIKDDIELF